MKICQKEEYLKAKIINKKVILEQTTVCCGDKNSSSIQFEIPKVIDGINVTNLPVYIKTENCLGGKVKKVLKAVESGDNLLIDWLLGAEESCVSGKLKCQIVFERADGELILNSEIFEVEIFASVSENGPKATAEYSHITQMQNQLANMLSGERWQEVTIDGLKEYVKNPNNLGRLVKIVPQGTTYSIVSGVQVVGAKRLQIVATNCDYQGIQHYSWYIDTATGTEGGTMVSWFLNESNADDTATLARRETGTFSISSTHKFYIQV